MQGVWATTMLAVGGGILLAIRSAPGRKLCRGDLAWGPALGPRGRLDGDSTERHGACRGRRPLPSCPCWSGRLEGAASPTGGAVSLPLDGVGENACGALGEPQARGSQLNRRMAIRSPAAPHAATIPTSTQLKLVPRKPACSPSAKCRTGKMRDTRTIQLGALAPSGMKMPERNRSGRIVALTIAGEASAFGMTVVMANARVDLGVATILLICGVLVIKGSSFARWVGIIAAVIAGVSAIWWMPFYPVWAFVYIVIAALVVYALAVYGGDRQTVS
jgi:hypothetical protein